MGAGKPGLQRPRNDRRFPPPGVKDVASYGWTTLQEEGWRTEVAHVVAHDPLNNYKSALSEGEALAVVVQAVPGNPHWTRVGTDSPNPPG